MNLHQSASKLAFIAICIFACNAFAQTEQLPDDPTFEELASPAARTFEMETQIKSLRFEEPKLTDQEVLEIRSVYSYIDQTAIIPQKLKDDALAYFHANQSKFSNQNYVTIVDFSSHSSLPRMYIIDMKSGAVSALHVAHGKGSDTNNDGYAERFSNISGSEMSSLGYYLVSETYQGSHGLSVRLDGLSSTDSNVRARAIVIHGSNYVSDKNVTPGRSWGCFAIPMSDRNGVVQMLHGGSLMYAGLSK